jgi:hypothetical protein
MTYGINQRELSLPIVMTLYSEELDRMEKKTKRPDQFHSVYVAHNVMSGNLPGVPQDNLSISLIQLQYN